MTARPSGRRRSAPCATAGSASFVPPSAVLRDLVGRLPPSTALMNGSSAPSASSDCCSASASTGMSRCGILRRRREERELQRLELRVVIAVEPFGIGLGDFLDVARRSRTPDRRGSIRAAPEAHGWIQLARALLRLRDVVPGVAVRGLPFRLRRRSGARKSSSSFFLRSKICGSASPCASPDNAFSEFSRPNTKSVVCARLLGTALRRTRAARARRRSIVASEIG